LCRSLAIHDLAKLLQLLTRDSTCCLAFDGREEGYIVMVRQRCFNLDPALSDEPRANATRFACDPPYSYPVRHTGETYIVRGICGTIDFDGLRRR
jgi:hypothetical protein